jgi:hypothetical protein
MVEIEDLEQFKIFNRSLFQIEGKVLPNEITWDTDSFPKKKCFDGVSLIQEHLERIHIHNKAKKYEDLEKLSEIYQGFDQLLDHWGSVYVLCIDVRFINTYLNSNPHGFDEFVRRVYGRRQEIGSIFQKIPNLLKMYSKFEHDYSLGVNLHCILLFKHSSNFNEQDIVEELENQFDFFDGALTHIQVKNWNQVVRENFSNKAVGHIGKANKGKIDQFKYWILSYFYLVDNYIKLEFSLNDEDEPVCEINHTFWGEQSSVVPIPKIKKAPPKPNIQFKQLVSQSDEKKIWSTRKLSKKMKARIALADVYYSEQFSHNLDLKNYLLQFESMAAMLQQDSEQSFLFPILPVGQTLNEKELRKCLSLTGKRLFSLLKRSSLLFQLTLYDLKQNVGLNVLSMFENIFFAKNCLNLESSINFDAAKNFNRLAAVWRGCPDQQMKNIFSTTPYNNNLKQYFYDNSETLNSYLAYKHKVCEKRFKSSQEYIQDILAIDIYLLHVKLTCELKNGVLSQESFSKAFTSFIKNGKRTKSLKWLSGYLGLWKVDAENNPYVDMYIFLNTGCEQQVSHIERLLAGNWHKFITEKSTKLLNMPSSDIRHATIELLPIYHSRSEYAEKVLLIRSKDKNTHSFILETLVKFIVYHDFFQADTQKNVRKVLIKGSSHKN